MNEVNQILEKYSLTKIKYNLFRIKQLIKLANINLSKIKFIHITGSKGKGSTAFYISKFLESAGLKVGLFTSPHILDVLERIKINSKKITTKEFCIIYNRYKLIIEKIKPSYFELITFIAIVHFAENKIDWAVMEVGLGGRLDATNIIKSEIAIITNIELEHTKILGNSKTKILKEKREIIKKETKFCITGLSSKYLIKELEEYCKKKKVKLIICSKFSKYEIKNKKLNYEDANIKIPNIKINQNVYYQLKNILIALNAISLTNNYYQISYDFNLIKKIIEKENIFGRYTIIKKFIKKKDIMIDCAHTPESIRKLITNIDKNKYSKILIIFNCLKDKKYKIMLNELIKLSKKIYIMKIDNEREIKYEKLEKYIKTKKIKTKLLVSFKELKEIDLEEIDLILVTGSFYLIAKFCEEYKEIINRKKYLI
ncbi:MAG TPA: Mur ligase family protein [bacterium]|nr:Mur ligase family protein [bacterium]HOL46689.1 Mur ligase family protein [bacterium]HPQ18377.1 Mur ligase family protein [bacterium]